MKNTKLASAIFTFSLLAAIALSVSAQKLPTVQENSLRAPGNIKIDGKATEWGNIFHAYNHATGIFYSMANDDDNLYLIIQATNSTTIQKIILGGITLTINTSGKKNDKDAVAVTFPKYDKHEGEHSINLKNKPEPTHDTIKNNMQADSFMQAVNHQLAGMAKMIEVIGVKTIADSLISIYNDQEIKAAALFDKQINYTCELRIPIKYIGISINKTAKIHYQIKLNGASTNNAVIQPSGNGRFLVVTVGNNHSYAVPVTGQFKPLVHLVYPTDFWGEYTFAKK